MWDVCVTGRPVLHFHPSLGETGETHNHGHGDDGDEKRVGDHERK